MLESTWIFSSISSIKTDHSKSGARCSSVIFFCTQVQAWDLSQSWEMQAEESAYISQGAYSTNPDCYLRTTKARASMPTVEKSWLALLQGHLLMHKYLCDRLHWDWGKLRKVLYEIWCFCSIDYKKKDFKILQQLDPETFHKLNISDLLMNIFVA